MRQSSLAIMFLAFILMSSAQADTVTISASTPFAEDSGASSQVRNECEFENRLPNYIKKAAKKRVDIEMSADPLDSAQGRVLFLETTKVFAPGGGGYSGSKSVTVVGELKENGEVIGSLTARRHTMFGMMPGTCSILKRVAKKLGQDIAIWLAEPTMDAKLGDTERDVEREAERQAEGNAEGDTEVETQTE